MFNNKQEQRPAEPFLCFTGQTLTCSGWSDSKLVRFTEGLAQMFSSDEVKNEAQVNLQLNYDIKICQNF